MPGLIWRDVKQYLSVSPQNLTASPFTILMLSGPGVLHSFLYRSNNAATTFQINDGSGGGTLLVPVISVANSAAIYLPDLDFEFSLGLFVTVTGAGALVSIMASARPFTPII